MLSRKQVQVVLKWVERQSKTHTRVYGTKSTKVSVNVSCVHYYFQTIFPIITGRMKNKPMLC